MPPLPMTSAPAASTACSAVAATAVAPIRLPSDERWTLAERMAAERDAFGFYFSAHPVDAQRHLLAAHKVRSFAEVAALPLRPMAAVDVDAGRADRGCALACLGQGRRFLTPTLSDACGQYQATAFDDEPSADLESAAKSGACGLMTVELDRRPATTCRA